METINTTPARNTNNQYVETATKELQDLFDKLTAWEKEHNPETECFGYASIPYCLKRTRETGIDKIFFVGRDYHGKYEDDYCYFTYWDEVKKEFFSDEWGTWAAFPHYDYYEMPIDFGAGWECGLIDKEAYLQVMKERHLNIIEQSTFDLEVAQDYRLRVSVEGGRKFKGEGYLVNVEESSYRFAHPRYRNHSDDYGLSTTYTAVIWNPIDNTLNRANLKYVKYLDEEQIMKEYKEWAVKIVNRANVYDIKSNNQYNLGSYILDVDYSFNKFMADMWMQAHNIGDVTVDAYDPEEEERKKKASEYRASKMPGILEWVKNNTDKTGEEAMLLAIRIFNKNHNG